MIAANQQDTSILAERKASGSKVIPFTIPEPIVGISILIPVFNYDARKLVSYLHEYYTDKRLDLEIICCDDGSSQFVKENQTLNNLEFCTYYKSKKNRGRSQTRNFLAQKASKDYLLFLDCDVLPKNVSFLQRYFNAISQGKEVVFGGLEYTPSIGKEQTLRWLFGIYREAFPLEQRILKPYEATLTSNLLIKKNIFKKVLFEESLTAYGYEDFVFVQNLQKRGIEIHQIANETYHLNVDKSEDYIEKVRTATRNLVYLYHTEILSEPTKIIKVYNKLKRLGLPVFLKWFYQIFRKRMEKNLISRKPSLTILDIYKASYFCYHIAKKP
ncbi:Glycosyl transferase family 2 [Pustulibacterium marinum]|uniref:Glycosyl transferase family 2 n=1 Tax=Pustulibacterium marinum TaxID=1224947 RepID=A0A1I7FW71_9FLAO|nr:glycosyltransferase [Pustulibacterium marinum]SFU40427.1 Glycosyl transferase family 2 [Pustulibacterium marinum]